MGDEFTIAGFTIPRIAIYQGSLLVLWGMAAYIISNQSSITAMIPAFLGAPLMILGLLSERMPDKRHHLMHAAMIIALLMALAPIGMFAGMGIPDSQLTLASNLVLLFIGLSFMFCGIMSFRAARLAREAE
tara:strand:+ start:617 stop:1009 length:393 start_codon:yes stop_codon:yes gene_type:complete